MGLRLKFNLVLFAVFVAGLSISAPADRLEDSWLDRLKETAAKISSALGHST